MVTTRAVQGKILAANWKMNKTLSSAVEFLRDFIGFIYKDEERICDVNTVIIAPPFTLLHQVSKMLKGTLIHLSSQDVFWEEKGAFTGEISPIQLKDFFVSFSIVGHSERRKILGETDKIISKKVEACFKYDLIPILCVGENLEERRDGSYLEVVERQVKSVLENNSEYIQQKPIIIAYEPVWAIGTGIPATEKEIDEMVRFIKSISKIEIPVIYGGSVDEKIAGSIKDICDGALVGGASLNPFSFYMIIKNFLK